MHMSVGPSWQDVSKRPLGNANHQVLNSVILPVTAESKKTKYGQKLFLTVHIAWKKDTKYLTMDFIE